jgi:hypothetical protein
MKLLAPTGVDKRKEARNVNSDFAGANTLINLDASTRPPWSTGSPQA